MAAHLLPAPNGRAKPNLPGSTAYCLGVLADKGANRFSCLFSRINQCPQAPINTPATNKNLFCDTRSSEVATNGNVFGTNVA